jgi:hypothetical protein
MSAPTRSCTIVVKASSISLWLLAFRTNNRRPRTRAPRLNFTNFGLGKNGVCRINKDTNRRRGGHKFVQQMEALCDHPGVEYGYPRECTHWSIETGNEANQNWVRAVPPVNMTSGASATNSPTARYNRCPYWRNHQKQHER